MLSLSFRLNMQVALIPTISLVVVLYLFPDSYHRTLKTVKTTDNIPILPSLLVKKEDKLLKSPFQRELFLQIH